LKTTKNGWITVPANPININVMKINRTEILLALQSALLGEIYYAIRAIVFKYDAKGKQFALRYYLDREPNEDDFENIGIVATEFIANFKYSDFNEVKEECIYTAQPISQIDIMDGMVYCRKE
jgi:hypothetical protein